MTRVVVVDDDLALGRVIRISLQLEGFEVEYFSSPFEGLDTVANGNPPDALVLDLNMPGMDGRTFFKEARRSGFENPVLILSAFAAEQACQDLGASD